ncbi:MAG: hypothetical protein D6699_05865 [Aquificota bacterium]|nr:MAG: hypothetical protein D6699_05865 [Aquificota bacterium]
MGAIQKGAKGIAIAFALLSLSFAQEGQKNCNTNPLEGKEYCKYFWGICKTLAVKRLDRIKACLEKSQDYQEGKRCFERSWIEDLFQQ